MSLLPFGVFKACRKRETLASGIGRQEKGGMETNFAHAWQRAFQNALNLSCTIGCMLSEQKGKVVFLCKACALSDSTSSLTNLIAELPDELFFFNKRGQVFNHPQYYEGLFSLPNSTSSTNSFTYSDSLPGKLCWFNWILRWLGSRLVSLNERNMFSQGHPKLTVLPLFQRSSPHEWLVRLAVVSQKANQCAECYLQPRHVNQFCRAVLWLVRWTVSWVCDG